MRVPVQLPATMTYARGRRAWTEADAHLVDVSTGGALVCCDRVPKASNSVLVCMLSTRRGLCAAAGDPIRRDTRGGFAIRFRHVNNAMAEFLGELMDRGPSMLDEIPEVQIWID